MKLNVRGNKINPINVSVLTVSTSVLVVSKRTSLSDVHWLIQLTSFCKVEVELGETTSNTVQSSIYLYIGWVVVKSLIMTRKKRGPNLVPWGNSSFNRFPTALDLAEFATLAKSWRTSSINGSMCAIIKGQSHSILYFANQNSGSGSSGSGSVIWTLISAVHALTFLYFESIKLRIVNVNYSTEYRKSLGVSGVPKHKINTRSCSLTLH